MTQTTTAAGPVAAGERVLAPDLARALMLALIALANSVVYLYGRPYGVRRDIALPTECLSSLKIHQEQQQEERQAAGTGWTDNGLVFTTPKGRPLDPTNLTRRFRHLLHSAELRTIRFHDLRHSTATLLVEQGVDLVVIKELLGHAHIGVTADVYAHVRLRLQRQAIDTLGTMLGLANDEPDDPSDAAAVR